MIEFDRKISVGNIWTIAVVGVGLVAGWVQFGNNIEGNAKDIRLVEMRVSALESNLQQLLRELGAERVAQTRILTEIQSDLKYIKER
jgi:hypothetical protein